MRINVADNLADWRSSPYLIEGGRRYRVGLWLKGSGAPELVLAARWFSDTNGANYLTEQWLILDGLFAAWTYRSHDLVAPANAQSGDLMFRAAFATTVDIFGDDFSVRRVS